MLTGGQLLGKFAGPGRNGQQVEIKSVDGWGRKAGRYLIVQMDKTDKPNALNLKEVTAFGVGPKKGQLQPSLHNSALQWMKWVHMNAVGWKLITNDDN